MKNLLWPAQRKKMEREEREIVRPALPYVMRPYQPPVHPRQAEIEEFRKIRSLYP